MILRCIWAVLDLNVCQFFELDDETVILINPDRVQCFVGFARYRANCPNQPIGYLSGVKHQYRDSTGRI